MILNIFNTHLRQIILLSIIVILGVLLIKTLYVFLPGLLGGITLYILLRKYYFNLTLKRKWYNWLTALLFIIVCIAVISIPIYLFVSLVLPKVTMLYTHQKEVVTVLEAFSARIKVYTGQELFTTDNAESITGWIFSYLPPFLNNTANVLINIFLMFFFLYYFLCDGKAIEAYLVHLIPLDPEDLKTLVQETENMIRANALGIPIVSVVQGVTAGIGFLILGIKDWGILAFLTGVFAYLPFLGIMIVWIPMSIYLYSINQNFQATGLVIYSMIVTGSVDNIARLGLLKQIGNVHPMISLFGVIVGLKLFGFMGLIFGPLLISYFILLVKIYLHEFAVSTVIQVDSKTESLTFDKEK